MIDGAFIGQGTDAEPYLCPSSTAGALLAAEKHYPLHTLVNVTSVHTDTTCMSREEIVKKVIESFKQTSIYVTASTMSNIANYPVIVYRNND